MKHPFGKYHVFIIILAMVLSACSPIEPKATDAPKATQTSQATVAPLATATEAPKVEPTKESKPSATAGPITPKNAVTSLDDVKKASIQVEAQGTFIDPEVGMVVNGAGRGSGFIIDSSGIAVTNNHVVTGAALLKVWVGGNKDKIYNARVLGVSECSDLAVIKIDGADFPYLQWYDGAPKVGLEVYSAGFPLGDPEYTMTKGIVSKAKTGGNTTWASVTSVIEHDAKINPGNSGGPLVDKEGKVVAVNYAANSNNQYFAIARTEADSILTELKGGADVTSIGVNGQVIVAKDLKVSGVWVSSIKSGSPADKSGLKAGDIITQMEGLVLGTDGTKASYCQILRSHKSSETLTLNVLRWKTQEILEGQLNGRQLAVTGTFDSGTANNNGNNTQKNTTTTVSDDSNVISMVIPTDWQYDGSAWENTWNIKGKSYPFTAQTLAVSPDIKAYGSGWNMRGLFIATSSDWASMGGYANLLEGVTASGYKDCQPKGGVQAYKDDTYEGQIMTYNRCGSKQTAALVMAIRPIKTPQAYLVLFEMKFATDADVNELDAIMASANINP